MDILFVNMPMAGIERPSIALGTLKSILQQSGLSVTVAYANLWFAEYVGLDSYQRIEQTRAQDVLGDWLFGESAFPAHLPDHDAYLEYLLRANPRLQRASAEATMTFLRALRRQAVGFVNLVVERVLAHRPAIVGCTSMFQQNVASLALLRQIRERAPEIVTMMGGANCETVMGRTLHQNFDWVDYVVSGEADELITELCHKVLSAGRNLEEQEVPFGTLAPCHRRSGYPRVPTGDGVPRAIVQDMRKVPVPDYDDYFVELQGFLHAGDVFPGLPIETSRGCWWGAKSHCTFCGLNGGSMSFRAKPPAQARADIESLVARHRIKRIEAVDNILSTAYISELLPGLAAREERLSIFFEVKSNLKRHQVELFARAGIRAIQPGIESLDTRVLQLMRKGCAAWQNVLLLKWARQFGIGMAWNIILGFPGEQDDWHAETAKLFPALHHLQPGGVAPLRFDRYSPYHNRPGDWGLALRPARAYRFAYPISTEWLDQLAYFLEAEPGAGKPPPPGPGMQDLLTAHAAWRQAGKTSGAPPWRPPVLTLERHADGGARITDTRACAVSVEREVTALELAVLDAGDNAPSLIQLCNTMQAQHGLDAERTQAMVAQLSELSYLLCVDNRLVSLVLDHPVAPLQKLRDRPNGFVRLHRARSTAAHMIKVALTGTSE